MSIIRGMICILRLFGSVDSCVACRALLCAALLCAAFFAAFVSCFLAARVHPLWVFLTTPYIFQGSSTDLGEQVCWFSLEGQWCASDPSP